MLAFHACISSYLYSAFLYFYFCVIQDFFSRPTPMSIKDTKNKSLNRGNQIRNCQKSHEKCLISNLPLKFGNVWIRIWSLSHPYWTIIIRLEMVKLTENTIFCCKTPLVTVSTTLQSFRSLMIWYCIIYAEEYKVSSSKSNVLRL